MKLEDIGFYSLSDNRCKHVSLGSQMKRCEMIITEYCNFSCPYCRGLKSEIYGDRKKKELSLEEIKRNIDYWCKGIPLENIRFSGGEPTLHPHIIEIVQYAKAKGINRIAISTNGSNSLDLYKELCGAGVNDFSISLDACCAEDGDRLAGGKSGAWEKVVSNIKEISKLTYVTVGVVLGETNIDKTLDTVMFADSLGVSDIRLISTAQENKEITDFLKIPQYILDKYPILNYRYQNYVKGRNVRGIKETDSRKCPLVLDDSVIAGDYHFPCVIYMREKGEPIGKVSANMRKEREKWFNVTDCHKDIICKNNCLDVCIDYNNQYERFKVAECFLNYIDSSFFTWEIWRVGSIKDFGIPCRYDSIVTNKEIFIKYAIGWCYGENLSCRPKKNHVAVMFDVDGDKFWFHMRNNEFIEVFKEKEEK